MQTKSTRKSEYSHGVEHYTCHDRSTNASKYYDMTGPHMIKYDCGWIYPFTCDDITQ